MFNYDNVFFRFMSKVADVMIVSLLWLLFSIPVVTLGPSTSALYYTVHKVIKGGREYVWRSFWGEFKNHIKDSIICTVIVELLFALLLYDMYFFQKVLIQNPDGALGFLYYFFYILLFLEVIWGIYVFCYRARFEMGWRGSLLNGFKFFISNFGWSMLIVLGLIVCVIIVRDMPFFIFVLPALMALLCDFVMERVFRLVMTDEELLRERENDMDAKHFED
ncbi:MAG: DUF624 domain-containing protein [Lachnospiraceae bacterium]|nr:DUF624 domain-containing protein [Lachnospiraceae bacterium]